MKTKQNKTKQNETKPITRAHTTSINDGNYSDDLQRCLDEFVRKHINPMAVDVKFNLPDKPMVYYNTSAVNEIQLSPSAITYEYVNNPDTNAA